MKRRHYLLLLLLGLELAASAFFCHKKWSTKRPPLPDLGLIDPLAADEIRALAEQCRSPADWRQLGECYMAYGYFREAEACHREAARQAPQEADYAFEWAFSLERFGLLTEAIAQYAEALQRGSKADDCWYFIGRNRLRLEQTEEAREAFGRAGALPAARYERARLLLRMKQQDEALKLADALCTEWPRAIQPHYLRYRIERLTGAAGKLAWFADRAALAKERLPNPFDQPWNRLTKAYQELGAARVVKQAETEPLAKLSTPLREIRRRSWSAEVADLLADLEQQRGNPREARTLLEEVLVKEGPSAHCLIRLGDIHEDLGELPKALEFWNRAASLGSAPDLRNLHAKLHQVYEKSGKTDLAKHHLAEVYFGAGIDLFWQGSLKNAKGGLEEAVKTNPTHAMAWFYLGETHRLLGQREQARAAYERCLALRAEHSRARLGMILLD